MREMRWIAGVIALGLVGCSSASAAPEASTDAGTRDVQATDAPPDRATLDAMEASDGDAAPPTPPTPPTPPSATSLSILTLPLVPAFSTSIHDYYVQCAAGANALTVKTTAAPGSTIALTQPIATTPSIEATTMVSVQENGAIVAAVTSEGGTEDYWVRCLPHDFPPIQMNLHPDAGTPTPGYYLIGDVLQAGSAGAYAMAVDLNGVPVWYHTATGNLGPIDVDNVVPGAVSFIPDVPDTYATVSGQFEIHDLAAGTTSYVKSAGIPVDIHELRLLSNGDYLVLSDEITTGVDLTGLSTFGADEDMIGCDIQEVTPAGAMVWQWNATDHFDPVKDSTWPQTVTIDGKTVVDPFHCNAIDVDPNGDLLVSSRHMDSVFLIARATGAVLWKMGGATYTKEAAPYIAVQNDPETAFYRQHDARFMPNGDISLFDDQTASPGPARAVIYSYDVSAGTASLVWQYKGTVDTLAMGSFRILADGSRVIGWGVGGEAKRAFSEVDLNGNDLLDFAFTAGDATYRAIKIPFAEFELSLLRSSAGKN